MSQVTENLLEFCNRAEYASLPPSQIVPILADEKTYIGSESTIYRALKQAGLLNHRGRAKARTARAAPTTHEADAPNQVWMMDVTRLPGRVERSILLPVHGREDLYVDSGCIGKCLRPRTAITPLRSSRHPCGARSVCSAYRCCITITAARLSHTPFNRKCCRWA